METITKCKICGGDFGDIKSFSQHLLKDEKIKQSDYVEKYINKKDKWSGEPIPFKNFKHYEETDFTCRENFRKWAVKRAPKEEVLQYCFDFLKKRVKTRGLQYAPSHTELRALNCLSIVGFESLLEGGAAAYNLFCQNELGLKPRFSYADKIEIPFMENLKIFVDTREQQPLTFPCSVEFKSLNVGDYACAPPHESKVVVERKSMEDLVGTLGKGLPRFKKELQRADDQGIYLVVVVEEKLDTVLNYEGKANVQKFGNVSIFGVVRQLMQSHLNLQFLFANDRAGSSKKIQTIFGLGDKASTFDLQYKHDIGEI